MEDVAEKSLQIPQAFVDGSNGSPPSRSESPNMSWRMAKKALSGRAGSSTPGEPASTAGSLEGADAELCITLLERGLNFTGLKARLKAADQSWIEQFITTGGITALFDALEALGKKGFSSIADAIRQLECVGCVKAVMNNRFGLEFIIETTGETFVRKLAEGTFLHAASRHTLYGRGGRMHGRVHAVPVGVAPKYTTLVTLVAIWLAG